MSAPVTQPPQPDLAGITTWSLDIFTGEAADAGATRAKALVFMATRIFEDLAEMDISEAQDFAHAISDALKYGTKADLSRTAAAFDAYLNVPPVTAEPATAEGDIQ
jgi:hypothetical protein